jgi:hypothetical protein
MLGKPVEASVGAIQWGALYTLEILLGSPQAQPVVVAKLRSAGVDCFRYVLDNPLVLISAIGWETGVNATRIAVQVRGTLFSSRAVPVPPPHGSARHRSGAGTMTAVA